MHKALKINDVIKGQCKVLKTKDSLKNQQIVLVSGWNNVTPFVVWRYRQDDNSFHSGDYCSTIEGALQAFYDRN